MELFDNMNCAPNRRIAVDEDGSFYTHSDLNAEADILSQFWGKRRLVFLLCENTPGTLIAYLACLKTGNVPLLLDSGILPGQLSHLVETYHPACLCVPSGLSQLAESMPGNPRLALELNQCLFYDTQLRPEPELHPELCLLLTTSGSTGSPKLVRLSGKNLFSNARSIASYLQLTQTERPITNLPMSYSYGMSIVNSHILVGAPIYLTRHTVLEREFWEMAACAKITSLAGVPYTYQMFHRLGVPQMQLPHLRYLTQAGGKLPLELHREFAQWAERNDKRFYVMYGQTEAAPRMGYLPPKQSLAKCGSIGIPIPGGRFTLEPEDGHAPNGAGAVGELVYYGSNVAMGYARCAADLSKGDEWHGVLRTGDMAKQDADGYYYIVGRKKRFLKLFGNRVSLDSVEQLLAARFPDADFACMGTDTRMQVFTNGHEPAFSTAITDCLAAQLRISPTAFHITVLPQIPKTSAGKTQYAALEHWNKTV